MEPVTILDEPVPIRERLRLTRSLLAELDLLEFELDLVIPDRESAAAGDDAGDFVVAGGGLRLVLKLYWEPVATGGSPSDDARILTTAQTLLNVAPEIDAVVVVLPPAPYPAVVVDAFAAGAAVAVPSGSARQLPRGELYPSVREALRHLVAPAEIDWSGLPARPLVTSAASLANLSRVTSLAEATAADLRIEGVRARGKAKQMTWQALAASDAAWAASRVHGAATGTFPVDRFANDLDIYVEERAP